MGDVQGSHKGVNRKMKVLDLLAPYAKSAVPVLVAGILWLAAQVGITPDMSIEEAATLLVTAALVWVVPNRS